MDLIDRQDAIDALIERDPNCGIDSAEVIKELPSAQPEIVRCKDCINHGKEICYFWSRFYGIINTPDDGFCHKAERRTDETD